MKPLNRRLLIEVIEEEPQQGAFFVPVEEKVEEFLPAKVIACAEDCANDLDWQDCCRPCLRERRSNSIKGKKYTFIGENHLICVE